MIVANAIAAVGYALIVIGKLALPGRPAWVGQIYLLLSVGNIACLIAIWNWRKWGLFGTVGLALTAFVLNISLGISFSKATVGLIGLILLLASAYPKRDNFK